MTGTTKRAPASEHARRAREQADGRRHRLFRTVAVVAVAVLGLVLVATSSGGRSKDPSGKKGSGSGGLGGQPIDPSSFSPGACEAFPPTSGNRHLTVFLDAGHGGIDPGGVGTTESGQTIYEADETLPVELDTMAILRREGFEVVVSRTGDTSVTALSSDDASGGLLTEQGAHDDVAARAECANDAHANILIGIYFDTGSSPSNAGSVTGYDAVRPFATQNLKLANLVQNDVLAAMNAQGWQIPNAGVLQDQYLGSGYSSQAISYGHLLLLGPADPGWFDAPSEMPGALIEPLFITDPFEGTIAASSQGQQVIASGLAQAAVQYFAPSPAKTTTTAS